MNRKGRDSNQEITYKDCLGFCYFCAVSSSGQTSVCEIARLLSMYSGADWENQDKPFDHFDIHGNGICEDLADFMRKDAANPLGMYDFLYDFANFFSYSQPGLGSLNRTQSSCNNGSTNRFDFDGHADQLVELFEIASAPVSTTVQSKQKFKELLSSVAKLCHGVDHMLALQLVQLSAMFGLVPVVFCKFATLTGKNARNRGPNRLIRLCTSNSGNESCADNTEAQNSIFNGLCSEIGKCYGTDYGGIPRYSPSKLENTMCEIWRILQRYAAIRGGDSKNPELHHVLEVFNDDRRYITIGLGKKVDVAFVYRDRPSKFQLQNFFHVNSNHQSWRLQMFVHEIHKNSNWIHKIHLSNFGKSNRKCKMNNLMLWKPGTNEAFGDQVLFLDKSIKQFYISRPLLNDRENFEINSFGNKNWWTDEAYTDSGRSKHYLHYKTKVQKKYCTKRMKRNIELTEERIELLSRNFQQGSKLQKKRKQTERKTVSNTKNKKRKI